MGEGPVTEAEKNQALGRLAKRYADNDESIAALRLRLKEAGGIMTELGPCLIHGEARVLQPPFPGPG